jgi:hypothetical protein
MDGAVPEARGLRSKRPLVVFCLSLLAFWILPVVGMLLHYTRFFVAGLFGPCLALLVLVASALTLREQRRMAGPVGLSVVAVVVSSLTVVQQVYVFLVFFTNAGGLYG